MAESTELPLKPIKGAAVWAQDAGEDPGTLPVNNDTDQVLVRNTLTGRIETVSKASLVGGGGTQDLQQTLANGNVTDLTAVFTDPTQSIEYSAAGLAFNDVSSGLQTQFLKSEQSVEANFLLPAPTIADDYVLPILFTVDGGSVVAADSNGIVDLTTGGGGSQNLASVLAEGNSAEDDITLIDPLGDSQIRYSGTTIFKEDTTSGFGAALSFNPIIVDGAVFRLPSVTVAQEYIMPVTVSQIQPNDGGDIPIGLTEVLNQSAYSEDTQITLADSSTSDIINIQPSQVTIVGSGSNSIEINQFGIQANGGVLNTAYRSEGSRYSAVGGTTTLTAETPTTTNVLTLPNKSGIVATLDDITGGETNLGYAPSATNGTVTNDNGDDAILPLATGTNAGLLAPGDFTKLGNQSGTNTGDNATNTTSNTYADGKVADNMTASTTVAPSKTAVKSYIDTADALLAPKASPALTGTPTAPTAAGGTNTTQIATTAYVVANFDPIHTGTGYPFYTSGTRTMVTGAATSYVKADGSTGVFDTDVRNASIGTVTITNSPITSGQTVVQAFNRAQGQINARALLVGASDIEITDATKGIILKDAGDASRRRITIVNGVITVSAPL